MKWVILDRDGVINEESDDYIKSVAEWQPIAGSLEAIARMSQAGARVCIATNQSGIGRGLFGYDTLMAIHQEMQRRVQALGGRIEAIAFAPEHPDQATPRRKPAPGMLLELAERLQQPLSGVPFVGDSWSDIQAARAAGARPVLVRSGRGGSTEQKYAGQLDDVFICDDLRGFAERWLRAASLAG